MRQVYIPAWLEPLMGVREKAVANDPSVKCCNVDVDGEYLGANVIELCADVGSFTIDSARRAIIR